MQVLRFLSLHPGYILRVAIGVLSATIASIAYPQSQPDPSAVFTHKETRLRFPPVLGSFRHVRTFEFPNPKLGTCVIYVGSGQLQLCVYNGGHASIPTGTTSQLLRDALEEASVGTLRLANTPPLSEGKFVLGAEPKVEREGRVAAATGRVFESILTRPDGSSIGFSHGIVMTAFRDYFLKLSLTRPRAPVDAFVQEATAIVSDLLRFNPDEIDAFFASTIPPDPK